MGEMTISAERVAAISAIGKWPGRSKGARAVALHNGTVGGISRSAKHAEDVWNGALAQVYRESRGMGARAAGAAPLAMVAALASHLGDCERCWRTGPYGDDTPIAWLMWACAKRPGLAEVVAPVMSELAGLRMSKSLDRVRVSGQQAVKR